MSYNKELATEIMGSDELDAILDLYSKSPVYLSEKLAKALMYTPEEACEKSFTDFIGVDEKQVNEMIMKTMHQGGNIEISLKNSKGTFIPSEIQIQSKIHKGHPYLLIKVIDCFMME